MTVFVLLPAYNEEKGLPEVLRKLISMRSESTIDFQVVVVDDGSKDQTTPVALQFKNQLPLHVITFERNRGVAEVFRQAFLYACTHSRTSERDIAVVLDSDNTQDPNVMKLMIDKINAGDDVVIASRFEGDGRMIGCPPSRAVFSYGISWILRILARMPKVKDYSTFYRAYRISILKEAFNAFGDSLLEGKGFSVAAGLLLKIGTITKRISEVPLILRYDLKGGASGNKIWKTINGYLQLLAQYILTDGFKRMKKKQISAL